MTAFNFKLSPHSNGISSLASGGHEACEINFSSFDMRMHHLFMHGKKENGNGSK